MHTILAQEQTHTILAGQQMDIQAVTALAQEEIATVLLAPVLKQVETVVAVEDTVILVVAQAETAILVVEQAETATQANRNSQIVMLDMETVTHLVETVTHQGVTATLEAETAEALVTA
jgi:hypothetical protein